MDGGQVRVDVSGLNFDRLLAAVDRGVPEGLGQAAEHIRGVAASLTPVESGRLVGSAAVEVDGDQASITYAGPYARYQHERLDLHHEHGQAKFLEQPMRTEQQAALQILAQRIKDEI